MIDDDADVWAHQYWPTGKDRMPVSEYTFMAARRVPIGTVVGNDERGWRIAFTPLMGRGLLRTPEPERYESCKEAMHEVQQRWELLKMNCRVMKITKRVPK